MTAKRFEIIGVGYTNIDVPTYIVKYGNGDDDCFELYESKEDSQKVVDLLNELADENEQLKKENQGIQDKVMRLLDYVETNESLGLITRREIKKWWNGDVE